MPAPIFGRQPPAPKKAGWVEAGPAPSPSPAASLPPLPHFVGEETRSYFVTLLSMAFCRSSRSSQPAGQSFSSEASCSLALAMSPVST